MVLIILIHEVFNSHSDRYQLNWNVSEILTSDTTLNV